jgi:Iodothyronine deiodinase
LGSLSAELAGIVQLACIYIPEAHAQDEWPISSGRFNGGRGPVIVHAPQTDAQRLELARRMQADFAPFPMPVLCDLVSEGNPFERVYAPWPFRFFGIQWRSEQPVLSYIAHPRNCSYDLAEARDWALAAAAEERSD